MKFSESVFVIIENRDCPVYRVGDEFRLSDRALQLPEGKPACLTLMGDIVNALNTWERLKVYKLDSASGHLFNCTGHRTSCIGAVRLGHQKTSKFKGAESVKQLDREISAIAGVLSSFPIFKNLSAFEMKEIVSYFRIKEYSAGETIIEKGDPGVKLYIILNGEVEVLGDNNVNIAFLGKGEVFGEMSLLSGEPVGTTIRAVGSVKIIYMYGEYFREVLKRFPSIQMFFARLLARRLAISNVKMEREFSPGIIGHLSEISPSELLQTLNMNHKTGVVAFVLHDQIARICLRDGKLVHAEYGDYLGAEAFYEILKHKDGRFKFNPGLSEDEREAPVIGDFMYLLMEGLNRIDEGRT